MDGGLAVFGFGLFLFSIANLYARSAYGLAWVLLALSLVAMGMAFSESKNLRLVSLGLGVVLLAAGLISLIAGVTWWLWVGTMAFGAAFLLLWAEFRFPVFGHVRAEDVPPPGTTRRRLHVPFRHRRA
ncbi:hypothetical protein P2318_01230 [Myxococcaceae bacterium GXIMD 01537]